MAIDTPQGIVLEIAREDIPEDLFPEERAYVTRCVPRRVNEFVTVRACARSALAQLGYHRPPLLALDGHGPVWPRGTVGSMTHCEGFRAAVVGLSEQWLTLGIDAEPNEPLPPRVLSAVANTEERQHIALLLSAFPTVAWDRLLFSGKEALYKAWSPLMHSWLDFDEASIRFDPGMGTFLARLSSDRGADCPSLAQAVGRWFIDGEHLFTSVAVARQPNRAALRTPAGRNGREGLLADEPTARAPGTDPLFGNR